MPEAPAGHGQPSPGFCRELSIWQAIAVSVALMAPSWRSTSIPRERQGWSGTIPLAFAVATVAVLLIAHNFSG